jgi:hypothetical protein
MTDQIGWPAIQSAGLPDCSKVKVTPVIATFCAACIISLNDGYKIAVKYVSESLLPSRQVSPHLIPSPSPQGEGN